MEQIYVSLFLLLSTTKDPGYTMYNKLGASAGRGKKIDWLRTLELKKQHGSEFMGWIIFSYVSDWEMNWISTSNWKHQDSTHTPWTDRAMSEKVSAEYLNKIQSLTK